MANATGSCIEITYDTSLSNGYMISSWPSGTKILGGSGAVQSNYYAMIDVSWIDHAELEDGTSIPYSQYRTGFYDFGQEGIYIVRYYPKSLINPSDTYNFIPDSSFFDCGRIVSAKLIYANDDQKDIKVLKSAVFENTSLTCITLPEGFRKFGGQVLFRDSLLECITIPASMTEPVSQVLPNNMGAGTFDRTPLNKIFAKGMTAPKIASNSFDELQSGGTLYYPAGADYTEWLNALAPWGWKWATYNPYAVDTCDCTNSGENVPIIDSGTTIPPSGGSPYIYLSGLTYMTLASGGSCNSLPIVPVNCDYDRFTASIEYNPNLTAHSIATVTEENGSLKFCLTSNPNSGYTEVAIITVNLYDTSGNTYLYYCALDQYGTGAPTPPTPEPPIPSGITIGSGFTSWDMYYTGCPLVFDHSASTGTWSSLPSMFNINQTVSFSVPENDTDSVRTITYYFNWYSGETCEDLIDTVSYTISQAAGSGDTPPSERSVYLDPSEIQFVASANTQSYNLRVLPSGCTIDSSYTPTYVSSADWLHADRHSWSDLNSGWTIFYGPDRNTTNQTREGYITVNGVHDTDGNVYNGLVCHVIQYSGSYVFANYTSSVSSAETDTTVEIVGINTNICSVTVSGFTGYPANRWEGFEQPSYTQLGNYITVHIPENPERARSVRFSAVTVYGESCENTERLLINIGQAKSGATPTPVQKDIKAADADYSVGSGTGNASTTIQTSGCTYDHFTYITGGSFSVTATSGPNNTIVFTYPENPTNSTRTGYVYITFYDSDGNTYGPQTITFTQQAGSSPGPGPGPDPETGYVLTTLTISDQEQHRYFVEARPGVVYSAAGQYYKTVLACEARYSLYYVNSYGGVDVLPFKEKGWKKSDTITRFNYSRSFRNNTPEFENVNYMNEIKASWELHTGWLSDEQSKRMHELIESTIVYLYDAEEKTYTPVVMTDKKLEYKTYHNQGKKFYNYTVNVEESQSRERR